MGLKRTSVLTPVDIGVANAIGTIPGEVRVDHVHNHPAALGFDLHHDHYAKFWPVTIQVPTNDANTMTTARVYLMPVQVLFLSTVDRICVICAAVSAGNMTVGIYEDNGGTPVGGALVVESASLAKPGNFRHVEYTIADTQLVPGLYWVAVESDEATTILIDVEMFGGLIGRPIEPHTYDRAGGYGPLTDPCPATANPAHAPLMYLRVASVP